MRWCWTPAPRRGEDAAFEDAVALAASFVYTIDTHECLLDLLFVGFRASAPIPRGAASCSRSTCWKCSPQSAPSEPAAFPELARAVVARRDSLSSVILILLSWDEERRKLAAALRAAGAEVRALLVCAEHDAPRERPPGVLLLVPGKIEQGLAALR